MTGTKTGRPPKYSKAQVLMGVELVEQRGETPTGILAGITDLEAELRTPRYSRGNIGRNVFRRRPS